MHPFSLASPKIQYRTISLWETTQPKCSISARGHIDYATFLRTGQKSYLKRGPHWHLISVFWVSSPRNSVSYGFQIPNNGRDRGFRYSNKVLFQGHLGSRGAIKSPDTFVMGVTHPSKNTRKRQCDTYKWYRDTPNSSLLTPISGISLGIDTLFRCLARVSILGSFFETPKIEATLVLAPLPGASALTPPPTPPPPPNPPLPLPNPSPTPIIASSQTIRFWL